MKFLIYLRKEIGNGTQFHPEDFTAVGIVDVNELEDIYIKCQNTENVWLENCVISFVNNCRSLTVFDVIQNLETGEFYMIYSNYYDPIDVYEVEQYYDEHDY